MNINKTNVYCLVITLITIVNIVTIGCNICRINTLNSRCNRLEDELKTIKNEVVTDYQSYVQLHNDNK